MQEEHFFCLFSKERRFNREQSSFIYSTRRQKPKRCKSITCSTRVSHTRFILLGSRRQTAGTKRGREAANSLRKTAAGTPSPHKRQIPPHKRRIPPHKRRIPATEATGQPNASNRLGSISDSGAVGLPWEDVPAAAHRRL